MWLYDDVLRSKRTANAIMSTNVQRRNSAQAILVRSIMFMASILNSDAYPNLYCMGQF